VVTQSTTFSHRYGCYDSVKTTFFPLTTKGVVSEERGETNVVSVIEGFYPPSTSVEDRL